MRTVIDLRAPRETAPAPSAWAGPTGARLIGLSVAEGGEGADTNYSQMLLARELDSFDADDMGRFYIDLIVKYPQVFGESFGVIADPRNLSSLVHCAADKDRTGVFVALTRYWACRRPLADVHYQRNEVQYGRADAEWESRQRHTTTTPASIIRPTADRRFSATTGRPDADAITTR